MVVHGATEWTHEWFMRLGRFVLAPPHADCGYECREMVLIVARPALPMLDINVDVLQDRYTAPWKMLPSCAIDDVSSWLRA